MTRRFRRTKAQKRQLAQCPSLEVQEALLALFQAQHHEHCTRMSRANATQTHMRARHAVARAEQALHEKVRTWTFKQGGPIGPLPPIDAIVGAIPVEPAVALDEQRRGDAQPAP